MEDMLLQALKFEAFITPLVVIIIVLTIAIYFWRRSGSSYGIKSRLYSILSGNKGFQNSSFTELWHEQQDIERFNALFNLNAKSTTDIINFTNWVKKYNLHVQKFSAIKQWFDISTLRVKKTNKISIVLIIISILFLLVASILIARLGFSDSVMIKFKHNNLLIWLNSEAAKSVDINPLKKKWLITNTECTSHNFNTNDKADITGIEGKTIQVVCDSFQNEETKQLLKSALQTQKQLVWAAAFLFVWSVFQYIKLYRMSGITVARRHLLDKIKAYTKNRDNQRTQQR